MKPTGKRIVDAIIFGGTTGRQRFEEAHKEKRSLCGM